MTTRFLSIAAIAVAAALPSAATAQSIERPFERTLSVTSAVSLSVTSGSGSIKVSPGSDGTVRVTGVVRGTSWWGGGGADVQRAVETVAANPPIRQNGGAIEIGEIADSDMARRVSISYEITLPRGATLRSKTGSGSQQIGALAGPVTVSTGSGSVEVGAIGGAVDVSTGSGSVQVAGARSRTSVNTGSGSVHLGQLDGDVRVSTGSGSIDVEQASGGKVDLSTGSGSITVASLSGGLAARTASGSVKVGGTPKADWTIETSSGRVSLVIPDGNGFTLDASTSSGSIETDHALTVKTTGRHELVGTVGAGGSRISARTTSGSIQVRKST